MMQSPQILYALARQNDRIAPPRTTLERVTREETPVTRATTNCESRTSWFLQLLFWRRQTAVS